jgi:hypothetical protein
VLVHGSVPGKILIGFVLAFVVEYALDITSIYTLTVWLHVLAGIVWIGLLYYFNFVQVPAMGEALADSDGPGPAAIGKYIAPRALLWFRMAAATTWLVGLVLLYQGNGMAGIRGAFELAEGYRVIGVGAWFGTRKNSYWLCPSICCRVCPRHNKHLYFNGLATCTCRYSMDWSIVLLQLCTGASNGRGFGR